MTRAFVGVGSNIEPAENVRKALDLLAEEMPVVGVSTVYETEAESQPEQPRYYNCIIEVETGATPAGLKQKLREIEESLGRIRTADKYAPRTIDLDLLVYEELSVMTAELTLADLNIVERAYLAAGLAELAPDLALPGMGTILSELAERLPKRGMRALNEYTAALRKEVLHGS